MEGFWDLKWSPTMFKHRAQEPPKALLEHASCRTLVPVTFLVHPCRREHVFHQIRFSSWRPKQNAPNMIPKSTPQRPQEASRLPKMSLKTKSRLRRPRAAQRPPGSHLGQMLASFWSHFRPMMGQLWHHFSSFRWCSDSKLKFVLFCLPLFL